MNQTFPSNHNFLFDRLFLKTSKSSVDFGIYFRLEDLPRSKLQYQNEKTNKKTQHIIYALLLWKLWKLLQRGKGPYLFLDQVLQFDFGALDPKPSAPSDKWHLFMSRWMRLGK